MEGHHHPTEVCVAVENIGFIVSLALNINFALLALGLSVHLALLIIVSFLIDLCPSLAKFLSNLFRNLLAFICSSFSHFLKALRHLIRLVLLLLFPLSGVEGSFILVASTASA